MSESDPAKLQEQVEALRRERSQKRARALARYRALMIEGRGDVAELPELQVALELSDSDVDAHLRAVATRRELADHAARLGELEAASRAASEAMSKGLADDERLRRELDRKRIDLSSASERATAAVVAARKAKGQLDDFPSRFPILFGDGA